MRCLLNLLVMTISVLTEVHATHRKRPRNWRVAGNPPKRRKIHRKEKRVVVSVNMPDDLLKVFPEFQRLHFEEQLPGVFKAVGRPADPVYLHKGKDEWVLSLPNLTDKRVKNTYYYPDTCPLPKIDS